MNRLSTIFTAQAVCRSTNLDEADVLGVAAEALAAAHQPVLPDKTMRVRADATAVDKRYGQIYMNNMRHI
jgi:hypothetical protein